MSGREDPAKLPFKLKGKSTQEAMIRLGCVESELDFIPLSRFKKIESNPELAMMMYKRNLERRKKLIDQIIEEKKKIKEEQGKTLQLKTDPVVLKERRLAEVNKTIVEQKNETNKQILKRIAISQLRTVYKVEKSEKIANKVDALNQTYNQRLQSTLAEANKIAQTRTFKSKAREIIDTEAIAANYQETMEKHHENLMKVKQEERKRIEKMKAETAAAQKRALKNHEQIYKQQISSRQEYIDKVENRAALIPAKKQEQEQKIKEKAEQRKALATQNINRANDIEQKRVKKAVDVITTKEVKAKNVLKSNNKEIQQKITQEKKRLEKMTAAANEIFDNQKKELEEFRQFLDKREEKVESLVNERDSKLRAELLQRQLELEEKTAEVRRLNRIRAREAVDEKRRKILRDTSQLSRAAAERTRSELAKSAAEEEFNSRRRLVESEIGFNLVGLPERKQIKAIMDALGVSEEEATEICELAKRPSSDLSHY